MNVCKWKDHHYINKKENLYLKKGYRYETGYNNKYILPSIFICDSNASYYEWILQPIADGSKIAQLKAYNIFLELVETENLYIPDFGSCNLCLYKNKPYILDW